VRDVGTGEVVRAEMGSGKAEKTFTSRPVYQR
jgi:hypothetical protein